jgi:hypothetical protein
MPQHACPRGAVDEGPARPPKACRPRCIARRRSLRNARLAFAARGFKARSQGQALPSINKEVFMQGFFRFVLALACVACAPLTMAQGLSTSQRTFASTSQVQSQYAAAWQARAYGSYGYRSENFFRDRGRYSGSYDFFRDRGRYVGPYNYFADRRHHHQLGWNAAPYAARLNVSRQAQVAVVRTAQGRAAAVAVRVDRHVVVRGGHRGGH